MQNFIRYEVLSDIIYYKFQTIEEYSIENDGQNILKKYEKDGMLTEQNRFLLEKCLCEFLYSRFGPYPKTEEERNVSRAVIRLFPCMKYVASQKEGIVCSFFFILLRTLTVPIFFHMKCLGIALRFSK